MKLYFSNLIFLAFVNPFNTEDEEDASYQLDYEPKYASSTQVGSKRDSMRSNFTFNDDNKDHTEGTITLSRAKIALKTLKIYAKLEGITNKKLSELEMILNNVNERK